MSLRRGLRRAGLPVTAVNIWADPAGAERVRSIAQGNETVPTVVVGDVELVNPSVRRVLEVVGTRAPELLVADQPVDENIGASWPAVRIAQWMLIAALIVTSELVAHAGHSAASWGIDALAVVAYLGSRILRRRSAAGVSSPSTARSRLDG